MAGNIHFHPAPGLGDLLPGFFVVPQDPISMARQGVTVAPGIGDILPGTFVVPQNPVKDFVAGQVKMIGQNGTTASGGGNVQACGCGCGGNCGGGAPAGGMGQITTDLANIGNDISTGNWAQLGSDFGALLQEPTVLGIPLWVAGLAAYFFITAIREHRVTVSRR